MSSRRLAVLALAAVVILGLADRSEARLRDPRTEGPVAVGVLARPALVQADAPAVPHETLDQAREENCERGVGEPGACR